MKKLKIASLFSGVGTPEQSLKHSNIEHETVFACEIDKFARITYLANNQEPNTFYEDVYNIDGNKYKDKIDILVGGSPCQSFSIAGKRLGISCPRGNLIYEYVRIVEESQPKVFIYENVKGFLSIDKGETFKNFVQSFKDIGYTTYHQVLNTKDYGVPQNRERIYIVGFRENIDFEFAPKQELKLRLKDMLEDSVNEKYYYNSKRNKALNETSMKIIEIDELLWVDAYNRLLKLDVSSTITTRIKASYSTFIYTNGKYRFPTERECFRLQGFDDSFVFAPKMSDSQLYKQAGNGMSRNILDMLFTQILIS